MTIPVFVPSEYCLACRGCCVFLHSGGDWSVRLTAQEASRIESTLAGECWRDGDKRICLKESPGGRACYFLDETTHCCRVYPVRPFECRLYPFLLSSELGGIRLYAHEACPYVREKKGSAEWFSYLARLRAFFSSPDARRALVELRPVLADYSSCCDEMEYVCEARLTFPQELLQERPRFERYVNALSQDGAVLSSRSFVNLFVWQDHFDFLFKEVRGVLTVGARQPAGFFYYLPPLGDGDRNAALVRAFEEMREWNRGGSSGRIENVSTADLASLDTHAYRIELRAEEYVYCREKIASLSGGAFKSQRHEVNVAARKADFCFRRYKKSDRESCRLLLERWLDKKRDGLQDGLLCMMQDDMRLSHAVLWDYGEVLGVEGRVVGLADGTVAAYTFGVRLNARVFCVMAEVADPACQGLAAYVFQSFANDAAVRDYEFLNVMDSAGSAALKAHKLFWNPVSVEPVYALIKKDGYV